MLGKVNISEIKLLRRIALPIIRLFDFDFSMTHPWVKGFRIRLNSFLHKGYWYFRRDRERQTMNLFGELIGSGAHVVEVGGHIGYITAYFAALCGRQGQVTVFEPGSNNLPYIRHNIARMAKNNDFADVKLFDSAVGPSSGQVAFFEDNLTGQNNSLVKNFKGLENNAKGAFVRTEVNIRTVNLVTLDEIMADSAVDFIKIDVEGFELGVLQGMQAIVEKQQPIIMVEVQDSEQEILQYFSSRAYKLYSEDRSEVTRTDQMDGNLFCLHAERHKSELLRSFGLGKEPNA